MANKWTIKKEFIALYTLVRRELIRMFRIFTQIFLPPLITTFLYFLIFGTIMGPRIGSIHGIDYPLFIAPGLMMMVVIMNSYSNVTSSLFNVRFQKNIEEMLVSPMNKLTLLLGFILGGILRGMIVSLLVFFVTLCFVPLEINRLPMTLFIVLIVSTLFALAGFANGLLARNYDDIALVPTFLLTPLTYLGGVFYSVEMLPPIFREINYINPIFHMINALRHIMIGEPSIGAINSIYFLLITCLILALANWIMLKKGVGILV